jgi:hypothetical protein
MLSQLSDNSTHKQENANKIINKNKENHFDHRIHAAIKLEITTNKNSVLTYHRRWYAGKLNKLIPYHHSHLTKLTIVSKTKYGNTKVQKRVFKAYIHALYRFPLVQYVPIKKKPDAKKKYGTAISHRPNLIYRRHQVVISPEYGV